MKVSPERKFPRDLSRWELPVYEFSDLDAFEGSPQQQTGVYAIPLGPGYLEALVQLRPGKPLVLFFHGTIRREKNIKLPVFAGKGVTSHLDVSLICVSDPTLYASPELSLGWYAGSQQIPV